MASGRPAHPRSRIPLLAASLGFCCVRPHAVAVRLVVAVASRRGRIGWLPRLCAAKLKAAGLSGPRRYEVQRYGPDGSAPAPSGTDALPCGPFERQRRAGRENMDGPADRRPARIALAHPPRPRMPSHRVRSFQPESRAKKRRRGGGALVQLGVFDGRGSRGEPTFC